MIAFCTMFRLIKFENEQNKVQEVQEYCLVGFIQGNMFMQVFLILTCLPLVAVLRSPHLNVHDFSEKTKPFYCPSGANFMTKSKNLRETMKSVCSLKSSCSWTMSNGCSAFIFSTLMNKQFEVVIINLYSSHTACIGF
jgi:hypothetical protein